MAAGRKRGPPPSEEEVKRKREEKNRKDREYRAKRKRQLEDCMEFCQKAEIAPLFEAFMEKREQESMGDLKCLEEDLEDVPPDTFDEDTFVNSLLVDPEMFPENLAGSSNVASGSMNSSATGGVSNLVLHDPIVSPAEPHHDPLGMQGETSAAAGSSSGPTTQPSPYNEMF
ncbi:hypothetical protein SLEP1_g50011 [Rubroshorea leprosula]|uniref:BZIP domain-containing protein n=1 Tax=Rubroshorea leprosula TaxID=152421 RepID=A0AAV5LZJ6_9ROSI|nr:hypothetical protein SLEP1_g50011 [Rubroshorea leprosula]